MWRRSLAALFACAVSACAAQPRQTHTAATPEAAEPERKLAAEPDPDTTPVASKEARHSTGVIARRELDQVLDGAPGRFLQHVETEPRFVGGRFRGWKLAAFFPGDARFAAVDLLAGDVILSVNGQSLEQPDQLMKVWDALRHEHALVVAIERDGQPRQLRFDIRD